MTYRTIREIIDHVRTIHIEAAKQCEEADYSRDARLQLLAKLFRRQETALANTLQEYSEVGQLDVLETWIQFVPTDETHQALEALRESSGESTDATVRRCLELQEKIVDFFRQLAEFSGAPDAQEVLGNLAELEQGALKEMGMGDAWKDDA